MRKKEAKKMWGRSEKKDDEKKAVKIVRDVG